MAKLFVIGFKDNPFRASGVLDELRVLDDDWVLNLRDAVAVHRDVEGKLHMDQSYQPTGHQGAEWGGALGLLIGATLAIPFTAGASAAVAAGAVAAGALTGAAAGAASLGLDARFWKDEFGLPEDFVQGVNSLIEPGSSAIYAVLESSDSDLVVGRFQAYGGTVLQLPLSIGLQARIEKFAREANQ